MQNLGNVQGDCNPLDRLMLGGIVTLPDGDCNHKNIQSPSGHIYTLLDYTILHVYESMITLTMLCNRFLLPEYFTLIYKLCCAQKKCSLEGFDHIFKDNYTK